MGADVLAVISDSIDVITDVIAIFLEPPLLWFVALAVLGVAVGIVKGLIPRKRSR